MLDFPPPPGISSPPCSTAILGASPGLAYSGTARDSISLNFARTLTLPPAYQPESGPPLWAPACGGQRCVPVQVRMPEHVCPSAPARRTSPGPESELAPKANWPEQVLAPDRYWPQTGTGPRQVLAPDRYWREQALGTGEAGWRGGLVRPVHCCGWAFGQPDPGAGRLLARSFPTDHLIRFICFSFNFPVRGE
jgi:hypothetical protein